MLPQVAQIRAMPPLSTWQYRRALAWREYYNYGTGITEQKLQFWIIT